MRGNSFSYSRPLRGTQSLHSVSDVGQLFDTEVSVRASRVDPPVQMETMSSCVDDGLDAQLTLMDRTMPSSLIQRNIVRSCLFDRDEMQSLAEARIQLFNCLIALVSLELRLLSTIQWEERVFLHTVMVAPVAMD